MVVTKHFDKVDNTPPAQPTQFQLVTFVVGAPSETHDPTTETQGRPFEFESELPTKFSAMCPFCCQGFYIEPQDIIEKYDCKFVGCPECGTGKAEVKLPPPPFTDPFVNPFNSKQLMRCELDETVTPIADITKSAIDDSLTVAQKMGIECAE